MEQGRRAMRAALSLPRGNSFDMIPAGIYTIPEIATIGIDADSARAQGIECVVGTARFDELARGQIAACTDGVLHLVVDCATRRIRGCQVLGEGATELVHLAQMAMATGASVETFVDGIFNFPTMAEAYRVAALDADAQLLRMAHR